jgi:16S rRNA (adenine1518-N6/adenine1519-N6)-dimethyltransferase
VSASRTRAFLEQHGLAAHRDRGQNFLHDERVAERLVELAGVGADEAVIEIGTGLGMLTRCLAARARHVETIEIDAGLVRALGGASGSGPGGAAGSGPGGAAGSGPGLASGLPANVRLRHADALAVDLSALLREIGAPARVVANLPYSVATPLLRRFLDLGTGVRGVAVMVQRELAARIRARPGSADYGSLAVLHAWAMSQGEAIDLPASCFHPAPKVTSTFLCMSPRDPALAPAELRSLEGVVRAGFAHRRKTLINSLARAADIQASRTAAALREIGLDARVRAEQLDPGQWLALARCLLGNRSETA